MPNVFTAILPILYRSAARVVPRELTGVVGASTMDFADTGVAKGDTVTVGIVPIATVAAFTPAQAFTAGTDRTPTSRVLTLNQENVTSWNLTGEQERSLMNGGNYVPIFEQTVAQHLRAHVNAIENYVWGVGRKAASRATGTAGTSPFATDQKPLADALRILLDNGVAKQDLSAVFDTVAGADLRKVSNLFKVNEAGNDMVRTGVLGSLYGFDLRESNAVSQVVSGTGTAYTTTAAGFAVGTTSLPLITGSGTVLAGDVVTFAGDTNKYVVAVGVAAPGTIQIAEPGLRVAMSAATKAMTIGSAATQSLFFHRNALQVVARPGLQPVGPAVEQEVITDPQSGLSFLLYRNVGDGMASWYMRCVFDAFSPNPYAIGTLLG
jgi:hypothetical protein